MSAFEEMPQAFEEFTDRVRLLPLPDLVLFPHVMQPLHIYEPRYRELLEDAIAGDRLIAVASLAPGWERDRHRRPAIYSTACLGRVTAHCQLRDGTYNVLVLGLRRLKLLRELASTRCFRQARARLCDDVYAVRSAALQQALRQKLGQALRVVLPTLPEAQDQLDQFLDDDVPLGLLTDVVGYLLNVGLERKLSLLAEVHVYRRVRLLLGHLTEVVAELSAGREGLPCFPPQFSGN